MAEELVFLTTPWIEGTQLTWTLCNQGDQTIAQWAAGGEYTAWPIPPGNTAAFGPDTVRIPFDLAPKELFHAGVDISNWAFNFSQGRHYVQVRIQHPNYELRELEFEVKGTLLIPIGEKQWP